MKITGELEGRLDVKLYLNGLKITEKCPKCNEEIEFWTVNPLYKPLMNDVYELTFCCEDCNYFDFNKKIKLNVNIEEINNKKEDF